MNEQKSMEKADFSPRTIGRRETDFFYYNQVLRLNQVTRMGQAVTSILGMDELFQVIIDQTNQIMDTLRSTVFLHDEKTATLWSFVATAMEKNTIRIPDSHGVAGWVFQNRVALILNDPYSDPRFYGDVDSRSGFKTKNILCVPVINRRGDCIGVFQALNKKVGIFDDNDTDLLVSLSHYVAIALENAHLYEELRELDRVKERIINHLSHELKTPLAVLLAVLGQIAKKLDEAGVPGIEKTVLRGQRNLNRLLDLQSNIDDIVSRKSAQEKQHILQLVEDAATFVQKLSHDTGQKNEKADFINMVSGFLHTMIPEEEDGGTGEVDLSSCLQDVCDEAEQAMAGRSLAIRRSFAEGLLVHIDKSVLCKVFSGLLKNAIENTPDEGVIDISAKAQGSSIAVSVSDPGVGITEQNKKNIFVGFFHTQDTDLYATKNPYEFNAGGSGADLLRIKVFSERYGFSVAMESSRCRFLPTDREMCGGSISACPFITDPCGCRESGGTVFTLTFPRQAAEGGK